MRKQKWVLYKDGQEYYIIEDIKTPIKELKRLDHFEGIYIAYSSAREKAVLGLKFKIEMLKRNIHYIKKGPPK